jgi:hypothetical protein
MVVRPDWPTFHAGHLVDNKFTVGTLSAVCGRVLRSNGTIGRCAFNNDEVLVGHVFILNRGSEGLVPRAKIVFVNSNIMHNM